MAEPPPILPYDPNRLFDALCAWSGVTSDKMLARVLGLSPALIHRMRTGRLPVRASLLEAMADAAGKSVDELRHMLGDRRKKMRMSCGIRIVRAGPALMNDAGNAVSEM